MLFLMETGVRVRELCDIRLNDIDWKDGLVKIRGKNGQERHVPIQETVKREMKKYVTIRGQERSNYDHLWLNQDNEPLSSRQVQQNLNYYGKKAGIKNVRVSPHTFRHTFAKMAVQNGANIFSLQKVLGHSTLEMVRRYVNMFDTDVAKDHQKFGPVQRLF